MDSAARLQGPLASASSVVLGGTPRATATPLTVIRRDRPQDDPALGPAARVVISPAARALAAADERPLAQRPGKDSPASQRTIPAANETNRPASRNHMPDQLGPRDAATRVQGFGGLNVRRSTGGPKLTSGD